MDIFFHVRFFSILGDKLVFPYREGDVPGLSVSGNEADSVEEDGDISHQGNAYQNPSELPRHTH